MTFGPPIHRGMSLRDALVIACALAGGLYVAFAGIVLGGRLVLDRRQSVAAAVGEGDAIRLALRASRHAGRLGRWRRAAALVELGRLRTPHATRDVYRCALDDPDPEIRAAAVRGLGPLAPERPWAVELLVETLADGTVPRSRVAAVLDHLAPLPQDALAALTRHESPQARYWAAMLLARYDDVAGDRLTALLVDPDPSVRRAAVEAIGVRGEREALPAVLALLTDETMYVRAHACRAAGRLAGPEIADRVAPLLADREWWVRAAAKDTLRSFGPEALDVLLPVLRADDRFARNGAAEVLQDVGVLDRLASRFPAAPIVADIYAAGEHGLRRAAVERLGSRTESDEEKRVA